MSLVSRLKVLLVVAIGFLVSFSTKAYAECPQWMDQSFRQLHSNNTINLCQQFKNKPLLLVNTASYCGFTHQFSGLETIYQRYKNQGLAVVGFSSNDFRQEAANEKKAASICYENYGVSFTMMAPISVKGKNAHPLFKWLASESQAPSWNFNKFLVNTDGTQVQHFGSTISPDSDTLNKAIQELL